MREHLFRAKRVDNGEWVEGIYYKHQINETCHVGNLADFGVPIKEEEYEYCILRDCTDGGGLYNHPLHIQGLKIFPETVEEFTGLCDKNGKKIFEGDILSIETYVGESTNPTWKNVTEHEDTLFTTYYCTRRDEAIVRFNQYKCEFDLKVYNSGRYKRISKFKKVNLEYYHAEIIGNIHDNPELLEV